MDRAESVASSGIDDEVKPKRSLKGKEKQIESDDTEMEDVKQEMEPDLVDEEIKVEESIEIEVQAEEPVVSEDPVVEVEEERDIERQVTPGAESMELEDGDSEPEAIPEPPRSSISELLLSTGSRAILIQDFHS